MGANTFTDWFDRFFKQQPDIYKYQLAPYLTLTYKDSLDALNCQPVCDNTTNMIAAVQDAVDYMAPYLTIPTPPVLP